MTRYAADRVAQLAEEILRLKRLYYAGKPGATDSAYDNLEDELRRLSPDHPVLAVVGAGVTDDGGAKIQHTEPMLSLQKTYERADLTTWMGTEEVVGTVKVDGVSLSVLYEKGALKLAKTRGNGRIGEDVTAKVLWIPDVRPHLDLPVTCEIRGELYCTEPNFLKLSDAFAALDLERPTSPRNVVAGLLGRKSHIDLARYFNFFAFSVAGPDGALGLTTEEEASKWLENQGFRLPHARLIKSEEELDEYLEFVRALADDGDVGVDGAVFSLNSFARQRALGNTSHHPRFKISFKWQGATAVSTIRTVAWATSRLGVVTPVAVIEPVNLSGATITNVTLHNAAHVKAYNLKAGDQIEVVRSGEVIPKFLQVVRPAPGEYAWPDTCRACATKLVFDDVRLRCPNTDACPAQQLGAILNWIRAAEIDDLSDKRLQPLIDLGKVRWAPDLYRLTPDDFCAIPLIKEKMAAKLHANIEKSKQLPLARFLNGLGIEGAGLTTWEKLLETFHGLEPLRAATAAQIADIDGFADKTAEQITLGLAEKSALIDALLKAGLKPDVTPYLASARATDGPLVGKTLVITGALSRPRAEVERAIKTAGGKCSGAVSKATHAVVTDEPESTSTKMKKARELGIPIWSEADLMKAIGL